MSTLEVLAAILALAVYLPLSIQVLKGTTRQNFATWFLWGVLDAIAAGSIALQHGNWVQPAMYVVGCVMVVLAVLKTKTFAWGKLETFITAMVVICLVVWYYAGSEAATIASTTAVVFAGVPQLVGIWQKPEENDAWPWACFGIANILATAAGKDWSIAERFYPAVCAVYTILFVIAAMRKYTKRTVPA